MLPDETSRYDAAAPRRMEIGHKLRNIPLYDSDTDEVRYYTGRITALQDGWGVHHHSLAPSSVATISSVLLEGPGKPERYVVLDVSQEQLKVSVLPAEGTA